MRKKHSELEKNIQNFLLLCHVLNTTSLFVQFTYILVFDTLHQLASGGALKKNRIK